MDRSPFLTDLSKMPNLGGLYQAVALLGASLILGCTNDYRVGESSAAVRTTLELSDSERIMIDAAPSLSISPDGSQLALAMHLPDGTQRLYRRSLPDGELTALAGTEGGETPFFSPDGQWIGFFANGELKKVPAGGGEVVVLCEVLQNRGAHWGSDDQIIFTPNLNSGLWQVSSAGGDPEVLTTLQEERTHRWPHMLPGATAVLYGVSTGGGWDDGLIVVESLETRERRVLIEGGTHARYSPSGHIVYVRAEQLMSVPFDLKQLRVTGPPVALADKVMERERRGSAHYSFSDNGTLVYFPAGEGIDGRSLVWVNRDGSPTPTNAPLRVYEFPRLSPDGNLLAVTVAEGRPNVYLYDFRQDTLSQFTSESGNTIPIWTPDGAHVTFRSTRAGPWNVFWKPVDTSNGSVERLTTSQYLQEASAWSPDGQTLVVTEFHPSSRDLWIYPRQGDPQTLLDTAADEAGASFSPDGRWFVYSSTESGQPEVYVAAFPGLGEKRQISSNGGVEPVWSRNGKEIFFRQGDQMLALPVETQARLQVGQAQVLFEGGYERGLDFRPNYDVTADAQRFLMVQAREPGPAEMIVVENWFEELKP